MRTYLVTGGAGFIGSNYIHYMFRKYDNEIRIINVDALTYAGNLETLKPVSSSTSFGSSTTRPTKTTLFIILSPPNYIIQ